ncbi:MAG: NUDIX domain-containing protein [Bacillota bacterium]
MAAAFLMNDGEFLLMKRSAGRVLSPGLWAGVGGHFEPAELNHPQAACLREVLEETGIREEDISDLKLKYITLRRKADEIRVQHIFFGASSVRDVIQTDEGELRWISESDLLNRELSFATRSVLEHYLKVGHKIDPIMVGTIDAVDGSPVIHWDPLRDWE